MTSTGPALDPFNAYACPRTGAALVLDQGSLHTEDGARRYQINDNIPHFLRYEPAESEEHRLRLAKLNTIAQERGWREAITEIHPDHRYVTDKSRLIALELLNLQADSVVLEIGSSLGQFTSAIASRCDTVYGLEVVPGQATFARERCRLDGRSNVQIACGGDDCRLPYRDEMFDLVVMNLVFEWCSSRETSDTPWVAQRRLLEHARRVLKPGGQLYLSTKNRFALRLLIGKRDEHAWEMRFGNALPRWLLGMVLALSGRDRPQGLLHSHNALHRMLLDVGFEKAKSYWAAPEMRYPTRHVSTEPSEIRRARRKAKFVQGELRSTRLLMPLIPARWVRHFTPGLLFVATKAVA